MGETAQPLEMARGEQGDLAVRALAGDKDAERELCHRIFPAIRAFARRRLRGELAEDFAQDALYSFVQAIRAQRIGDPERAAAFALGICRNLAADRVRTRERRRELVERFGPTELPSDVVEDERWEQQASFGPAHLEDCLSRLTKRARDVVRATFFEESTDVAIAEAMSLTESNVRVIRHRSILALRECLQRPISWTVR